MRAALIADTRVEAIAPDLDIAVAAATLGDEGLHGDPADRFIYATARERSATLVTRDEALRRFDVTRTVW